MREKKYRIWDIVNKKMVTNPYIVFPDSNGFFWREQESNKIRSDMEAILMEDIGLRKIYEGDIVTYIWGVFIAQDERELRIFGDVIVWSNKLLRYVLKIKGDVLEQLIKDNRLGNVIGNIYEEFVIDKNILSSITGKPLNFVELLEDSK